MTLSSMNPVQQIELKTPAEIQAMKRAGAILAEVRDRVAERVKPGVTTRELDRFAKQMLDQRGAIPAFLGYQGFPCSICTSVNEQIVHGIPSNRALVEGDILSIDFGLIKDGFYADTARTVAVGEIDARSRKLLEVTEKALEIAIGYLAPGFRLGDLSAAVQQYVEGQGFSVVREYAGHGIGRRLHEEPRIPNYGKEGRGIRFQEGMVVAVEPMVNAGTFKTKVLDDEWTVVTADGSRSAHFEHTVAITAEGPMILTADCR
jgi:methionyl aminopeptidase